LSETGVRNVLIYNRGNLLCPLKFQSVATKELSEITMKKVFILAALVVVSTTALAQVQTSKGKVLVNKNKMTLYTYDKDTPGKSACNDTCAVNWPPYADEIALASASAANSKSGWGVITRDDGKKMWTYDGKPVYTFKNDTVSGEVKGDGVGDGAWHVVKVP
jgi:predicted lipoprotein with Yx(FWY)xxD motif